MTDNVSAEQLRLHIEAVENLEVGKADIAADIKDRYALIKADGFDTKAVKTIVKLRKMEKHARDEADAMLELYRTTLGI